MLNSLFKTTVGVKIKGTQPLPDDATLGVYTYEAMQYIATRTTPKSLITKAEVADAELHSLRTIEEGYYIRLPEFPDFSGIEPTEIIDMDEELNYATIYYVCYLITKGKSAVPDNIKSDYFAEAERLIGIFDSNFTRAGGSLYEPI